MIEPSTPPPAQPDQAPRSRDPRAPQARPERTATEKTLARLVLLAKAADGWERLWRGIVPPLIVIGLFLCVSWLGLWLGVPHLARAVGVSLFALLLLATCRGLLHVAPLSRRDALKRLDHASGLSHRPASVLDDTLATAGRDPSTEALWALHRRRAEAEAARLRPSRPSPRLVDRDRYALRAGVVLALLACGIIAGPQRYARVAAAFDFGESAGSGPGYRLDAWIDPPPYTGKPPVLLDLASESARDTAHPRTIAAPAGSVVIIRASGGDPAEIETTGPLLAPPKKADAATETSGTNDTQAKLAARDATPPGDAAATSAPGGETRLVLHGDSRLVLRHAGGLRGIFDLVAIPDKPPTIMLRAIPKANARGSLTLAYTLTDDYGVTKAEALFTDPKIDGEPTPGPALVAAPKIELALPGLTNGVGDGETTGDLSDSPWAGAQVTMTLVAHDDGGNEGRGEPATITLPQKPFANPLARALVEQRRKLVLEPQRRAEIGTALDALMIAPQAFGTNPSIYLGLRFAADSLAHAETDKQLVEVADFLWGMALQIENGDLSEAEKALRNAEKELRDAIDRKAPDDEIQKLTQNLQAAMDKFLKELAQQQKDDKQQADNQSAKGSKAISQKDLDALINKLKDKIRNGDREEAKRALDELQDILENLKTAKRQKADPQARAMAEGLNQLDQAMRDQQDLRDETFKKGQQEQDGQQGQRQQGQSGEDDPQDQQPGGQGGGRSPGQRGQGDRGKASRARDKASRPGTRQVGQGQGSGQKKTLEDRQQELRDRLAQIQKKLKQAGEGQGALDDAGKDMREAEEALRDGEGSNGQAVDAQGRALDALRKGAKKLADSMNQKGGEEGGQANSESEGSQGSQEGQQSGDADPLGRPRGGNSINSASRFDPLGIPAAQRAQRVLEELRRRLGDPTRNQEEIDYLERLLRSY